jgi:carboxypeptidase Q
MRLSTTLVIAAAVGCASPPNPSSLAPARASSTADAPPLATPSASALASAPAASAAPAATVAPIPDDIVALQKIAAASSHAYEIVRSLTDEVGPRLAGSSGDKRAVAWALRTLSANGFANVHTEKVMVRHWKRGAETAELVSPVNQALHVTALGSSDATPAAGIDAEVLEVTSMETLTALDRKAAAGKIVFIDVPTRRTRDGSGYGEAATFRFVGARIAQKVGAVAILVRSIGTDDNRLPHTGAKSRDDKGIPAAALSAPDAELLHRALAQGKPVRVHLTLTPKMLPDAESANVVGEIVGREKPDEVLLLGAHLDSWDLGTGAIDDGAGCAIVIDAARIVALSGKRPRRTLRVVLFANEENGREGGDDYAKAHASEVPKIVGALEADLGAGRAYETSFLGAPNQRARFAAIASFVLPLGVTLSEQTAHGGTDIAPLRALGVPMLDVAQDASRYFDWHHSANDTFDKIDKAEITQATAAVATIAFAVADMDGDLGRVPEEQRKSR